MCSPWCFCFIKHLLGSDTLPADDVTSCAPVKGLMESWSDDSWNCCHNWRNTGHSDTSVYHSRALLLSTPGATSPQHFHTLRCFFVFIFQIHVNHTRYMKLNQLAEVKNEDSGEETGDGSAKTIWKTDFVCYSGMSKTWETEYFSGRTDVITFAFFLRPYLDFTLQPKLKIKINSFLCILLKKPRMQWFENLTSLYFIQWKHIECIPLYHLMITFYFFL